MLVSTPFSSFAGCTVYKHAEEGGFEPATVAGASYYPLDDALIYDAGPGKFITDLVINEGSENAKEENLLKVGEASVWNTREEICATVEMIDGWQLEDVFIYLGYEGMPVSNNGTPKIGQFPFVENFSKPVSSYEMSVDLEDYFEFTWGKWDRVNRVWQISIYANVVMATDAESGRSKIHEEASALGMNTNETKWGWYSNYLVEHPETGHFIDAPVGGVDFDTSSHKGKTDANGAFDYIPGENVILSIGDLELGVVPACHKISPLDLIGAETTSDVRAINMARILQSLDDDKNPTQGISIPDGATESLNETMELMEITSVDFNDSGLVDELITQTVDLANNNYNLDLIVVSMDEAKANLDKGLQSNVFRKNISKTPELLTTKAKIELMPVYIPARRANGDNITLEYIREDDPGTIEDESYSEERAFVTPLVVTYTDENEETGASDVFAAVSRDDGNTWKVTNISRSAGRSSFTLKDGTKYYGDVNKPQCKVRGNYILIGWTSKFARSGKPRYSIKLDDDYTYDDEYYVEDIFGVSGPQRSIDYAKEDHPEMGEVPYSAIWTCRGVIDPDTGDIKWFKPERLTSGRRDACQLMFNGNPNTGYGLVWQEDPEGLRLGNEAGPGEGGSGATTNHKTDIWYSYISWEDFAKVDENFVSGGEPEHDDELVAGRDKVLVPCSMPIRISDNDVVNFDNIKLIQDAEGDYFPASTDDSGSEGGNIDSSVTGSGNDDEEEAVDEELDEEPELDDEYIDYAGTHMYGYLVPGLIFPEDQFAIDENGYFLIDEVMEYINSSSFDMEDYFYKKVNEQEVEKYVAITEDDRLLDGNTGASRPNIMMQPYDKDGDGKPDSAWVVVIYEETKGMGSGPPDGSGASQGDEEVVTASDTDSDTQGGTGAGADKYFPDQGKNVIYHTFDMFNPVEVAAGDIMNPQQKDEDGNDLWLIDEEGTEILDYLGQPIPAYENARRPRLIIQSKKAALEGKEAGEEGTVQVCVFKMGEEGQGRPSDILMTRFVTDSTKKGNPYVFDNIKKDEFGDIIYQNISSVTVVEKTYSKGYLNNADFSGKREPYKVVEWEQTFENLDDPTWENPYDDARAHRGIIRGDFLAIAYTWTPNWAPARNGNDHYDLFLRRSFDGGATWETPENEEATTYNTVTTRLIPDTSKEEYEKFTEFTTTPGEFEPARNVSLLRNNKTSVIEPRLVGTPQTIKTDESKREIISSEDMFKADKDLLYKEDVRNTAAYWVTYGTESYPGRNSDEVGVPLDIYYSYTTNYGQTYFDVTKTVNVESQGKNPGEEKTVWDWLAKDTGKNEAAQAECQIRMKPDGKTFWSVWNETGLEGSDVKFRKLSTEDIYGFGSVILEQDITPPVITISGVGDGEITNEDVLLDIQINEGSFTGELSKDGTFVETLTAENVPYLIPAAAQTDVYTLIVDAEDLDGNKSSKTITFTVDNRLSEITITGVTNGETTAESRTPIITTTGEVTIVTLYRNSIVISDFVSGDELTEDGRYELTVVSTDSTGTFSSTKSVEWVIDLEAPTVRITSVRDDEVYYKSVTPSINISDNHSSTDEMTIVITLKKDDEEVVGYNSGATLSEGGSYVLFASAVDLAGNEASDEISFKVEEAVTPTQDDDENDSNGNSNKKDKKDEPVVIEESSVDGYSANGAMTVYVPLAVSENDPEITILTSESVLDIPDNAVMINDEIYEITLKDADGNLIEEFDEPITFTYVLDDFTAGNMKEIKDLKISYWDEDLQAWVAMPTEFDEATKTLTAQTDHLSRFSVLSLTDFPEFEDIRGNKIENLIYKMASLGIVDGDENGDFRSEDIIIREEFIKLLMAASNEQPDEECNLRYSDSDNVSHWAKGYISKATEKGILVGYEDNTIRSKDETTHGECASIISKLYRRNGINLQYNRPSSAGVDYGWASKYFNDLMANGIIDEPVDSCCKLTRAEAADIIMKYMLNTH